MVTTVIVKQIIFTDKRKDWKPLENASGKFYMLHLEWDDGKWYSKFYNQPIKEERLSQLKEWSTYTIRYTQAWQYQNIISVSDTQNNVIIS